MIDKWNKTDKKIQIKYYEYNICYDNLHIKEIV